MEDLRITLIQSELTWENVSANLEMFGRKISAIKEATDLIILPEMFTTGFTMNNKVLAEQPGGITTQWMQGQSKFKNAIITGSFIAEEDGKYYNRQLWVRPDGSYEKYDKRHLFRMAEEDKFYTEGKEKLFVELKGWKICPMICYDLRFPVWSRNRFDKEGKADYDLLLYVANWPERRNQPREALLVGRAIENLSYVVCVNRVGNDGNNISHSGDSVVLNYRGEIISKMKAREEKTETVSLNYQELMDFRKKFPAWMDADDFEVHL